jgi:fermentation-respiration switch protein FrsA (DUF1100 family)
MLTQTFVDDSRATQANGSAPQIAHRTLVTTILYPASGTPSDKPQQGAPADTKGGPYPLIAFAHGTASTPQTYLALLMHWAERGFVVVAPKFPLSSLGAAGGVNVGDVVNQPKDVSYAISAVLKESAQSKGRLAGLIKADEIGAAGHSLGGITTIGLVANTCCKDFRVKAAIVMAGSLEGYPDGSYEVAKAPPLLVISGTDDDLVPYSSALEVFNQAKGPKALLTINGGNHGSAAGFVSSSESNVLRSTTDFFDAYLEGDAAAKDRLAKGGGGVTKMFFVPKPGATATVPVPSAPPLHLKAEVTPDSNLRNGQTVTVTWSGYTPGKAITILQCTPANRRLTNSAACDFTHAQLLKPNPTGAGSLPLQIVEGKVGTGTCDADHPGCFILVDNASSSDPAKNVFLPITFAK